MKYILGILMISLLALGACTSGEQTNKVGDAKFAAEVKEYDNLVPVPEAGEKVVALSCDAAAYCNVRGISSRENLQINAGEHQLELTTNNNLHIDASQGLRYRGGDVDIATAGNIELETNLLILEGSQEIELKGQQIRMDDLPRNGSVPHYLCINQEGFVFTSVGPCNTLN